MTNSLQALHPLAAGVPNPFKEAIANILQLALYVTQSWHCMLPKSQATRSDCKYSTTGTVRDPVLALYVTQVSGSTTGQSTDDAINNHGRAS